MIIDHHQITYLMIYTSSVFLKFLFSFDLEIPRYRKATSVMEKNANNGFLHHYDPKNEREGSNQT